MSYTQKQLTLESFKDYLLSLGEVESKLTEQGNSDLPDSNLIRKLLDKRYLVLENIQEHAEIYYNQQMVKYHE